MARDHRVPLRFDAGDRASWNGVDVIVEYVARSAGLAFVTYAKGSETRGAIVALADLDLRWRNLT